MQPLHLENVKIASKFTVRNVNSCIVSNVSSCTGGNVSNVKRNFKKNYNSIMHQYYQHSAEMYTFFSFGRKIFTMVRSWKHWLNVFWCCCNSVPRLAARD